MAANDKKMDYTSRRARKQLKRRERLGDIFAVVLLLCTVAGLIMLTALIIDVAIEGLPWLSPRIACAANPEAGELCDPVLRADDQTTATRSIGDLLDEMAAAQTTIGFMPYADYVAHYSRVQPVAIQNSSGVCVQPSNEAAPGATYPLGETVIVTNRLNDWVGCLTVPQVAAVFSQSGGIATWADLSGDYPAEPITAVLPPDDSGVYSAMQQTLSETIAPPLLNTNLFTNYHSRKPRQAGMKSAIVGSLIVIGLTGLISFPLGVGAAIYMEEYAPRNRLTNFINVNMSNLAGVPSIVYGMLGLAVFGRMFGIFKPTGPLADWMAGTFGGEITRFGVSINLFGIEWLPLHLPFERSMLAGGLTMTLLILPVIIIAAREAIRAVPRSIREAAYGLGATRWQVVSRQVLPAAFPGILTGVILALSRAIGETAPLIIMGAFVYVPFLPESIWDQFTAMPIQIYNWITLPQHEYRFGLAGAGIIILLTVLLAMNGLAVYLRNRFEIEW